MKAYCLASSSAGNCFVLCFEIDGVSHKIMIECGIPYRTILQKCNENGIALNEVEACLITHSHQDHCKSARELTRLNIPLFASKPTLEAISCKGNVIEPKQKFRVANGLFGMCFKVEHDVEGSVGFVLKTATECVIFIIDHKRFTTNISHFKPDYVFIECNYDHHVVYPQYYELQKRKDELAYEDEERHEINVKLKQMERNINSHASLNSTKKGLAKMDLSHCKGIFLTHLSDRYANEYRMKNEIQSLFRVKTYVCGKGGNIK